MFKRIPWFERTFAFDFPVAHAGPILERLRGTAARLEERVRDARRTSVELLEGLPDDKFAQTAIHPRLGTPMRVVDLMFFVAEHDDYHVARIGELIVHFRRG